MKKRPASGYTIIETIVKEGKGVYILGDDSRSDDIKENFVIAISQKDEENKSEWAVGDKIDLGEGTKGFSIFIGKKEYACIPNQFIIGIEKK